MRQAEIRFSEKVAGTLTQDENGYHFEYDKTYIESENPVPISLTFPLQNFPFTGKILFPFFDGLIPEGWLLNIAERNWKLNTRDRMGLLMACCKDCIGAVSVHPVKSEDET